MLPRLKEKISIERARMRLKAVIPKDAPGSATKSLRELLKSKEAKIESEDASGSQVISHPWLNRSLHRVLLYS